MNHSVKTGFSFGLTSAIITTLGLIVGLHAGTESKMVVISGILVIALADAFSDALGIHISEEAENVHSTKEVWQSTIATFLAKFFFALTFAVPVLLLELLQAVVVSVAWGLALLSIFSYHIAKEQGAKPLKVIGEHLIIAVIVIMLTHEIGDLIHSTIGKA